MYNNNIIRFSSSCMVGGWNISSSWPYYDGAWDTAFLHFELAPERERILFPSSDWLLISSTKWWGSTTNLSNRSYKLVKRTHKLGKHSSDLFIITLPWWFSTFQTMLCHRLHCMETIKTIQRVHNPEDSWGRIEDRLRKDLQNRPLCGYLSR